MVDKVTLTNLSNLQNETTAVNAINANNAATTTAMDNTLSRDGTSPNQMGAALDMNSNQIINLPSPTTNNSPLRFSDLNTFLGGTVTFTNLPTGGTTGQLLKKNSSTNYDASWSSISGDVSGTISTTSVDKIKGTSVSGTTGTGNAVLSASPTLTGTATLATAAVTTLSGNPNFTGTPTFASDTISGKSTFSSTGTPVSLSGGTTGQRPGSPAAGDVRYNTTLNGLEWYNGTAWIIQGQSPTVQTFTSGTAATYTPATGTSRIRVRMVGGGGGGGARATNNGSNGTSSSFGSWTAVLGNGGSNGGGAAGGGGSGGVNGTGTQVVRIAGGNGSAGTTNATASSNVPSGVGGATPFSFGCAAQQTQPATVSANSGGGGGGGGGVGATNSGSGGGGGEYVEFWVSSPSATTYTVGAGGAGGGAGGAAGQAGAAGIIIIEEFYA